MKRLRVVLVEDSITDAEMTKRLLISTFDIQHAPTFADLLKITRNLDPDVILLDLHLPDGGDYISMVMKTVAKFPQTAVIVITGLDDEMLALETLRVGAQDYLVKEIFVRDQMVKKIRHAHARKLSMVHEVSAATSMSAPIVDAGKLAEKIEDIIENKMASRFKTKTGVFDTVQSEDKLVRFVRNNWKFISGVIGVVGVYLLEVRNTVTTTAEATRDNTAAVRDIAQVVDDTSKTMGRIKQQSDERIEELEDAVIKIQVMTIKSTEHLEKMIEVTSPRTDFPEEPPELKQAKDDVNKAIAHKELFE